MSTDNRLKRLGLYHLRDNPEALMQELERRQQARRNKALQKPPPNPAQQQTNPPVNQK